jgi:hypothetical protein
LFFFEQLTGKWLHALDMRIGWKAFPTICSGRSGYHLFSRRTRFGVMSDNTIVVAPTTYPIALDLHEVKEAKAQRIILDGVKDPLIPHLVEKKTTKEMWDTLKNLYEAKNENQKMALKDKLHDTKMAMGEGVASYLTQIAQVKGELAAVGEVISEPELGRIALKGFTKEWDVFVKCVVGRENF